MSTTRLATNIFQREGCDRNQASTTVESVQQYDGIEFKFRDLLIISTSRASNTEAHNSRRGMLRVLRGATLDFAMSNRTVVSPEKETTRI